MSEVTRHNNYDNRKYIVMEKETGREVRGTFVLIPEHDSAARIALSSYAEATNKHSLARYIRRWLRSIHEQRINKKNNKAGPSRGGRGVRIGGSAGNE